MASSGWFSWACSSKRGGKFHRFTVKISVSRASRVNRVMVKVRVSVRIMVSYISREA